MADEPAHWYAKQGPLAWALAPAGWAYGAVSARRMGQKPKYESRLPVLCIGNFTAGGAGKTPTALQLGATAKAMDLKPGFLSRGYGGASGSKPTLVDARQHNVRDVGDEALLLAGAGPTVVCSDRVAGAQALEETNVDMIIMDDGFQNPALAKDFSLVVLDAARAIGNGFVHPAGPMRAPLKPQLARADALLLIGQSLASAQVVRVAAKMAKPVMEAKLQVPNAARWRGVKVLSFSGIGSPDKFAHSLASVGANVVERRDFPDHHAYSLADCEELLRRASEMNAALVTTAKDKVRLLRMGERHTQLHENCHALGIEMAFDNPKRAIGIIQKTIDAGRARRLKTAV
ncbi:MAG: tetraacyldisaccharide 4'-kinase [Pseudomonadota bacterium]